ncbi:MAG: class II fructose-bisphosphate aldolase [Solirubrobacteraceae bacterium]
MPVATAQQYRQMLDVALADGFAYPAVNVTSSQTLNGVLHGLAEAGSDGIVQVTVGGARYLGGGDAPAGARALAAMAHELAGPLDVLIAVHTDHAPPDSVGDFLRPLIAESSDRRARGEPPLLHSHMFDGSTLPLEENLRLSRELLELAAAADLVLEVEVGVVGGEEDGVGGPAGGREQLYTTTADLLRAARALGTGEHGRYLLAATFGNVHGVHAPGHVELRPGILRDGQVALAEAHPGARFAYVFHGSSGSSPDDVRAAIANGVVKVNLDTDAQYVFTRAIAGHVFANYDGVLKVDGGLGSKAAYDPRSWGVKAEAALAAHVAAAAEMFGSAGRTLLRS